MATLGAAALSQETSSHTSSQNSDHASEALIVDCILKILEVWGDDGAIRSCSHEQLMHLAKAILMGLAFTPEAVLKQSAPKLSQGAFLSSFV